MLAAKRNKKNQVKEKKTSKNKEKLELSTIEGKILDSKTGYYFIFPPDDSNVGGEDNYDIYKLLINFDWV